MEFKQYFTYCYNLNFSEKPNYRYLESLLLNVFISKNLEMNKITYDWDFKTNDLIEVDI